MQSKSSIDAGKTLLKTVISGELTLEMGGRSRHFDLVPVWEDAGHMKGYEVTDLDANDKFFMPVKQPIKSIYTLKDFITYFERFGRVMPRTVKIGKPCNCLACRLVKSGNVHRAHNIKHGQNTGMIGKLRELSEGDEFVFPQALESVYTVVSKDEDNITVQDMKGKLYGIPSPTWEQQIYWTMEEPRLKPQRIEKVPEKKEDTTKEPIQATMELLENGDRFVLVGYTQVQTLLNKDLKHDALWLLNNLYQPYLSEYSVVKDIEIEPKGEMTQARRQEFLMKYRSAFEKAVGGNPKQEEVKQEGPIEPNIVKDEDVEIEEVKPELKQTTEVKK